MQNNNNEKLQTKLQDISYCKGECEDCENYKLKISNEMQVVSKRKVSSHYVPPDMTAIKMIIELEKDEDEDVKGKSDEELNQMIQELMKYFNKQKDMEGKC